jgi:glutathione S-transferase
MILIGRFLSPYVRRVAITLHLYGLAFEHRPWATVADADAIRRFNPVGRVPVLVLDDGEVLIDSSVILDHLDTLVPPERALVPRAGAERRRVTGALGLAIAVAEKYVAVFYEVSKRPETHIWAPWREHLEAQITAGLTALDAQCVGPTLLGGALTQADVTVVSLLEAMRFDAAHLAPVGRYPRLEALVASVADVDAFVKTRPVR